MIFTNIIRISVQLIVIMYICTGCEKALDTQVFSELTPETILRTEDGIDKVLNSAYSNIQLGTSARRFYLFSSDVSSGIAYVRGGGVESSFFEYETFSMNGNNDNIPSFWSGLYQAIRDANIVIDNLDIEEHSEDFINLKLAETKFIRGYCYYQLYLHFGPIPLITEVTEEIVQPKASDQEIKDFIESELSEAAINLPIDQQFGKGTKGSALGILAKFYLNTKQWQKCAEVTKDIMDMKKYRLMENYGDIFDLENEGNEEILFGVPYTVEVGGGFRSVSLFYPPDYPLPYSSNVSFAAATYFYDDYINSFEIKDVRREKYFITDGYISSSTGEFVGPLLGNNKSLSDKYSWDPNSSGGAQGNDIPIVRYADILLTRAEALNELDGPNLESIELINYIRKRAGIDILSIKEFSSKENLREQILQEREWEFWLEGKIREDQIRHGVFIQRAKERGHIAQSYHILFPIPQTEVDANPQIEQNEGY